jgi:hypothetical protein
MKIGDSLKTTKLIRSQKTGVSFTSTRRVR